MIISIGKSETNKDVVLLGLTQTCIERLKDGEMMQLDSETHGDAIPPNLIICVMAGKTNADVIDLLKKGGHAPVDLPVTDHRKYPEGQE